MKRCLFTLIALFCLLLTSAQVRVDAGSSPTPMKPVEKIIYDTAHVTVIYDYGCSEAIVNGSPSRRYSEVALFIGEKYIGTMDWRGFKADSLQDDFYRNKRGSFEDFLNCYINDEQNISAYSYPVVVNLESQVATLLLSTTLSDYRYCQQLPKIEWKLENEEKKIKGIRCLKATCRFGGRDWTAWYAPEYPMPYGPYLFQGLPGLIMQVVDTKKNFAFKFKGIERNVQGRCVYFQKIEAEIETTRDKAREGIKNFCKDPTAAMKASGVIPKGSPLGNISSSLYYNPIELE